MKLGYQSIDKYPVGQPAVQHTTSKMIEYINGKVDELTPAGVVIDCNGLGYFVNISLNTYAAIQGKSAVKLYIYEAIREDAIVLYGFQTKAERETFLLLITVSGVGTNTARMIISAFSPMELYHAITGGNVSLIKSVKGIGPKTAERIIVDLKDKIKPTDSTLSLQLPGNVLVDEAVAALIMLGFNQSVSQKTVMSLLKENPGATVESIIKAALKML